MINAVIGASEPVLETVLGDLPFWLGRL